MIDGSEKRNRQLAFELENLHVCEKRGNITVVAVTCQTTEKVFHRRRNQRDSQRPQTLKNVLNFLVEFKTLFHESFKGSRKQFQSKRLVIVRTDVYVTADLYQAKRQDKFRIVQRYKINMLLLVPRGGGLPYERGGDARRLAQRCKFRVLVSLRVF